jgi:hypothetical protein
MKNLQHLNNFSVEGNNNSSLKNVMFKLPNALKLKNAGYAVAAAPLAPPPAGDSDTLAMSAPRSRISGCERLLNVNVLFLAVRYS